MIERGITITQLSITQFKNTYFENPAGGFDELLTLDEVFLEAHLSEFFQRGFEDGALRNLAQIQILASGRGLLLFLLTVHIRHTWWLDFAHT